MALAVAYDDAKKNQVRRKTPGRKQSDVKTPFFGSRDNPDAPHASLNHYEAGRASYSGTHFHVRDQFQVVVAGFKKWQCALCAFAYDEALGMPEEGIPAGTRWEDVPDTWSCPDCSASKSDFQMVDPP